MLVENENGSVEPAPDVWVRVTTSEGTITRRHVPPRYGWADPTYDLVHSSIAPCNRDVLNALRTGAAAETSGDDNFKTMQLVFGSYQSARSGQALDPRNL